MHSLRTMQRGLPDQTELLNGGAGQRHRVTTEPTKRPGAGFLVVPHPLFAISFCSVAPTSSGSACSPLSLFCTDLIKIVSVHSPADIPARPLFPLACTGPIQCNFRQRQDLTPKALL
jgi:hypothetical protein